MAASVAPIAIGPTPTAEPDPQTPSRTSVHSPMAGIVGEGSMTMAFESPSSSARVDAQLRQAKEILFSPPVVNARRQSMRWSAPFSPNSLELELQQATKHTKLQRLQDARRSAAAVVERNRRSLQPMLFQEAQQLPAVTLEERESDLLDRSVVPLDSMYDASEPSPIVGPDGGFDSPMPSPVPAASPEHQPTPDLQLHLDQPVSQDEGAVLLAQALRNSATSLTSLRAFIQDVGEGGAAVLADAIQTPGMALRVADMRFREIALAGGATLCRSLTQLPKLESLTLRCCGLGDDGVKWLCTAFLQSASLDGSVLAHLDLNENGITDIGCLAIGQLLMRHRTLTSLSLEENAIGTHGAYILGKSMAAWQTKQFHQHSVPSTPARRSRGSSAAASPRRPSSGLASPIRPPFPSLPLQPFAVPVPFTPLHPTSRAAAMDVAERLRNMETQQRLDQTLEGDEDEVSQEEPTAEDADESDVVQNESTHLRVIDAQDDAVLMTAGLDSAFLATLGEMSDSATNTPRARRHGARSSLPPMPEQLSPMATGLLSAFTAAVDDYPCALLRLNLRYNRIDVNDMSVKPVSAASPAFSHPQSILARYLTVSPDTTGLTLLDLSLNSMGDEGAVVLARSLAHNLSLTSLNVSYCHISDRGGIALSRALAFNTTLNTLLLANNFLGTPAATSFSDALSVNATLTRLDLSLNLFEDESVWVMCDSIGLNMHLREFDLHSCYIGDEGAEGLARACFRNTALKHVNVDQNPMSSDSIDMIQMALKHEDRGTPATGAVTISPEEIYDRRLRLQAKISALMKTEESMKDAKFVSSLPAR